MICEHRELILSASPSTSGTAFFMGKSVFLCIVEGNSLMRRDSWRLKGDIFWLSAGNPRKEPWRASCSMGACRRGMACGLFISRVASSVGEVGEDGEGAVLPGATDEPITVLSVSALSWHLGFVS